MPTPLANYTNQVLNNAYDDAADKLWNGIERVNSLIEEAHGDIEAECATINEILEDLAKVETEPGTESETILGAVYADIGSAVGHILGYLVVHQ